MPADRTPKKKAGSAKADSPKRSPTKNPGIRERKKTWKNSLVPWTIDRRFQHEKGTTTFTATNAKKEFSLDDDDLGTLPFQTATNPHSPLHPMRLYAGPALTKLTIEKGKALKMEQVKVDDIFVDPETFPLSDNGQPTVFVGRPAKLPKIPEWYTHKKNHQPPAKVIQVYRPPDSAQRPDPPKFEWEPSRLSGPVTVKDACRLYCLEPQDIGDLAEVSRWIDLASAAKRALELHGGFYAHMDLVKARRDAEISQIEAKRTHFVDDYKSDFRFSRIAQQEWIGEDDDDVDGYYGWMSGPSETVRLRVAVHYPVHKETDDYGCSAEYVPCWGDF